MQKKVVSDSPRLVDFAIGLGNSVINLPDGQEKFFEEFKLQKNCEINLLIKHELRFLHLLQLDAFRLVSLIDALPTEWCKSLKTCISTGDTSFNVPDEIKFSLNGQIVLLEKAYSKIVYKEL